MKGWTFTKHYEYDPLNEKANKNGIVFFWRGFNEKTGKYVIGNTKTEAINKAKRTY